MNVYPSVILVHVFIHILKKKIFFSFCNNIYIIKTNILEHLYRHRKSCK